MIDQDNIKRIKALIDLGMWQGPLLYYQEYDGQGVWTQTAYIT